VGEPLRRFPLAKASAPAKPGCGVFGSPLPAEVRGDACLADALQALSAPPQRSHEVENTGKDYNDADIKKRMKKE
jgi:hypothetical protein